MSGRRNVNDTGPTGRGCDMRRVLRTAVAGVMTGLTAVAVPGTASQASAQSTECPGLPAGIHVAAPPRGFDPLSASPATLRALGFPARPTAGSDGSWLNAMAHAKQFVCPTITSSNESAAPATGYKYTSPKWAGNEDIPDWYYESWAYWTVPSVTPASAGLDGYSVIWTGLGEGTSTSDELVQAGTKQYAYISGGHTYNFWYQITPGQSLQNVGGLSLLQGQNVYVDVWYNGTTTAHFFLENNTTGKYTTIPEPFNGHTGAYAEWIVERPKIDGSLPSLARWAGAINITDARAGDAYTGRYDCAGTQVHDYYDMYAGSTELAYPSSWTDSAYCNFPTYRTNN